MRRKVALLAIGVFFAAAGVWVSTVQIQLTQTNQCGANGCGPSAGSIPFVAPGAFLIIVGFVIVVYGLTRAEDEEDRGPRAP